MVCRAPWAIDEGHLEAGDSGGPSFVMVGGQLQLIGTHAAVGFL